MVALVRGLSVAPACALRELREVPAHKMIVRSSAISRLERHRALLAAAPASNSPLPFARIGR